MDLDDSPPPPIDQESVRARFGVNPDEEKRFPGGYYQSADGKTVVIAIRSGVLGADFKRAEEAINKVGAVVARVNPKRFDPSAQWGLTGDLAIGLAEYKLINRDLTAIGLVGAVLILGVVFLYYLRIRTVVAMGLAIGIGLAWTFGLTEIIFGHLNLATGFLFTIIGGNGINFSILFMARYLEERRRGEPAAAGRGASRPADLAADADRRRGRLGGLRGARRHRIQRLSGVRVDWRPGHADLLDRHLPGAAIHSHGDGASGAAGRLAAEVPAPHHPRHRRRRPLRTALRQPRRPGTPPHYCGRRAAGPRRGGPQRALRPLGPDGVRHQQDSKRPSRRGRSASTHPPGHQHRRLRGARRHGHHDRPAGPGGSPQGGARRAPGRRPRGRKALQGRPCAAGLRPGRPGSQDSHSAAAPEAHRQGPPDGLRH